MAKWLRVTLCMLLSFMVLFLGVGYAAVTGTLSVSGEVTYDFQYPVYITDVRLYYENNTSNALNSATYDQLFLNSSVTLAAYRSWGQTSATGTYVILAVTVQNSTERDYAYQNVIGADDVAYLTVGVFKDAACTVALTSSNGIVEGKNAQGEEQSLTFYVRMSHTRNSQRTYNPLLTFNFTTEISEKEEETVRDTVSHKFLEILNNDTKYAQLLDEMNENYNSSKGDWTVSYIGNVAGSHDDDSEYLMEAFDGALTLNLGGAEVNVTCIIKRENIDGDYTTGDSYKINSTTYRGCEMTLYMTTADFANYSYNDRVPVYAMVFTKTSANMDWEQIGETMYRGDAQVVGYVGGDSTGSFDTGQWRSTEVYHGVPSRSTIAAILNAALN